MSIASNYKLLAVAAVFLMGWTFVTAQELYEDSECQIKSGAPGTCKKSTDCKWLTDGLRKKTIRHSDIIRCGFEDNIVIVCCANPATPTTPSTTTTTTTVAPVPMLVDRTGQRKSVIACQNYSMWVTQLTNHILGGVEADEGEFPHMAVVGRLSEEVGEEYDWFCGGSLISEQYVLTAAHCTTDRTRRPTLVRLQDNNLARVDDGEITRNIMKITQHPMYKSNRKYHDISLLHLDKPVEFNTKLFPACLWTDSNEDPLIQERHTITVSGFGDTSIERRQVSSVLLKTGLEIAALDSCNQSYIDAPQIRGLPNYIQPSQICAVDPEGKNDTCQGDSGGPLQKIVKDHHHVIGVTSFGILCGSTTPSIYTRVSFYLDWIESIVWP